MIGTLFCRVGTSWVSFVNSRDVFGPTTRRDVYSTQKYTHTTSGVFRGSRNKDVLDGEDLIGTYPTKVTGTR